MRRSIQVAGSTGRQHHAAVTFADLGGRPKVHEGHPHQERSFVWFAAHRPCLRISVIVRGLTACPLFRRLSTVHMRPFARDGRGVASRSGGWHVTDRQDELDVYADGQGRRGQVDRRSFIRAGVLGTAMASSVLMSSDLAAGAAMLKRSTRTATPRGSGLVQAGPELALPPGFTYHTFGAFGSAMSDGFITPPIHDGMAAFDVGGGKLRIVRNHELGEGNDIPPGTVIGDPAHRVGQARARRHHDDRGRRRHGRVPRLVDQPQRHRHELRRHADPVGHVDHLRGDHDRRRRRLQEAARLRVRGRPAGERAGAHQALQEARPVPARGRCGRPGHRRGVHDRGRGPRRLLPFRARGAPATCARAAPDAPRQGPAALQHHRRPDGRGRCSSATGSPSTTPDPPSAEDDASAVFQQGRAKGGAKFLGGEGATYATAVGRLRIVRRRRRRVSVRSGSTRRRPTSAS